MIKSLALLCLLAVSFGAEYYGLDSTFTIHELDVESYNSFLEMPESIAIVNWDNQTYTEGWSYLYITTNGVYADWAQSAAAGYVEGYVSYEMIWQLYNNYAFNISTEVATFISNQTAWIKSQIAANPKDDWWGLVNTTLNWLDGIYAGYIAGIANFGQPGWALTPAQFHLLSYWADLMDVQGAYGEEPSVNKVPHCSFLLRFYDGNLWGSQTAWTTYFMMNRIYKFYSWGLQNTLVKNPSIAYSSYAGTIPSIDDFYLLSSGKFVAETTLGNNNNDMYSWIHYDSVPYWIRIMVANWAYDTNDNWVKYYFNERSGTYNNQWMIVDYSHFNAWKFDYKHMKDAIWMVEEFYNSTSVQDVTQDLLFTQGYVAGYNVPYNSTLEQYSQLPTNYSNDPRAILFQKYAPGITTQEEFQYVMRLNNISDTGDYCQAIASRCDLNPQTTSPWGAIDCKVTSDQLVLGLAAYIQSGPTYELEAPFSWANWPQYANNSNGQPEVFQFDWVFSNPSKNSSYEGHQNLFINA